MVGSERQQSWSEYLDKEKENKLFVRFVFTQDFSEAGEFAVVYLTTIGEETHEVVRYDCCKGEAVNVHRFYNKPVKKIYLNREKSFETLQYFIDDIKKNWRHYRLKFSEK